MGTTQMFSSDCGEWLVESKHNPERKTKEEREVERKSKVKSAGTTNASHKMQQNRKIHRKPFNGQSKLHHTPRTLSSHFTSFFVSVTFFASLDTQTVLLMFCTTCACVCFKSATMVVTLNRIGSCSFDVLCVYTQAAVRPPCKAT